MRLRAALTCIAALMWPSNARAQSDTTFYSSVTPAWVGHFTTASANALLSGVTAGLIQEIRGGSFRDGFTRGALGGAVIYVGKHVVAQDFSGAGLIGRQVSAVGTSIVRNASDAVGTFDRLVLPIGFTRVYWQRHANRQWRAKIDAVAAGWTIYGIAEPQLDLDFKESLSSGAAVFRTNGSVIAFDDRHAGGVVQAGVIFLSDVRPWGQDYLQRALAHERVHVLQMDQIFLTLNDPHDDQLLRSLPAGRTINRYVDINLSAELLRLLTIPIDKHADRPWEMEAIYLSR